MFIVTDKDLSNKYYMSRTVILMIGINVFTSSHSQYHFIHSQRNIFYLYFTWITIISGNVVNQRPVLSSLL